MAPVGIARHRMDTAVSGAGADGDDRSGLGRQPIQPFAGGHRLSCRGVVSEPAPIPFVLDLLVRDRPLDDQNERFQLSSVCFEEPLEKIVGAPVWSALEIDKGPMDGDLRQTGEGAERDLLNAGLRGGSQRHRIAVTTQSGVDPQNVDQGLFRFDCCLRWHMSQLSGGRAGVPMTGGRAERPPTSH